MTGRAGDRRGVARRGAPVSSVGQLMLLAAATQQRNFSTRKGVNFSINFLSFVLDHPNWHTRDTKLKLNYKIRACCHVGFKGHLPPQLTLSLFFDIKAGYFLQMFFQPATIIITILYFCDRNWVLNQSLQNVKLKLQANWPIVTPLVSQNVDIS